MQFMKYGIVMLSAIVDMISSPGNLCDSFNHMIQAYFSGTVII